MDKPIKEQTLSKLEEIKDLPNWAQTCMLLSDMPKNTNKSKKNTEFKKKPLCYRIIMCVLFLLGILWLVATFMYGCF